MGGADVPLKVCRHNQIVQQNLGAGGIHFRRAGEIKKGSQKFEEFNPPQVRRSKRFAKGKTLAQGRFTRPEQVK